MIDVARDSNNGILSNAALITIQALETQYYCTLHLCAPSIIYQYTLSAYQMLVENYHVYHTRFQCYYGATRPIVGSYFVGCMYAYFVHLFISFHSSLYT